MTKTQLTSPEVKVTQDAPAPVYTAVQLAAENAVYTQQARVPVFVGTTRWYVFGILSTIFCCLPCGVIGLVHAMIAKHEGERGNVIAHRRRLYQAKCWISWSIAIGLVFFLITILSVLASYGVFDKAYGFFCGVIGYEYQWNWNSTTVDYLSTTSYSYHTPEFK